MSAVAEADFENSVFAGKNVYNPHAVPQAVGMGRASWGLLGGQLGWVILAQGIAVLGCGAHSRLCGHPCAPSCARKRATGKCCHNSSALCSPLRPPALFSQSSWRPALK